MSVKSTKGRQTTFLNTRPATPTAATASIEKAFLGSIDLSAATPTMDTESLKSELLSSLRRDLVDILKTEVRAVLESEMSVIRSNTNAARSELKEYRQSITSELSTLNVMLYGGMEESLSACTDDISHLQKEV